jgi:hypothetical protein
MKHVEISEDGFSDARVSLCINRMQPGFAPEFQRQLNLSHELKAFDPQLSGNTVSIVRDSRGPAAFDDLVGRVHEQLDHAATIQKSIEAEKKSRIRGVQARCRRR